MIRIIECDTVAEAVEFINAAHPDNGWIEWNGGKCPVSGDTIVNVNLRRNSYPNDNVRANTLRWNHIDNTGDIVAYRVVK